MSSALTNREPAVALVRGLAQQIATLGPEQYGEAHDFLHQLTSALTKLEEMVEEATKKEVLARGETVTDKGTKALTLGEWFCRAIPNKTGTDPKKFEARLRTKGVLPENYMRAKVSYEMDPDKTMKALADGVLTQAELAACAYTLTHRLQVTKVATEAQDVGEP